MIKFLKHSFVDDVKRTCCRSTVQIYKEVLDLPNFSFVIIFTLAVRTGFEPVTTSVTSWHSTTELTHYISSILPYIFTESFWNVLRLYGSSLYSLILNHLCKLRHFSIGILLKCFRLPCCLGDTPCKTPIGFKYVSLLYSLQIYKYSLNLKNTIYFHAETLKSVSNYSLATSIEGAIYPSFVSGSTPLLSVSSAVIETGSLAPRLIGCGIDDII